MFRVHSLDAWSSNWNLLPFHEKIKFRFDFEIWVVALIFGTKALLATIVSAPDRLWNGLIRPIFRFHCQLETDAGLRRRQVQRDRLVRLLAEL